MANGFMEDYDDRAPSPGEAKAARKLVADAQALADVRTLDEWAGEDDERYWVSGPTYGGGAYCSLRRADEPPVRGLPFHGATPDEARAKAAAWVREQKR